MKTRAFVDFHAVPERQVEVHKRLENWAIWTRPAGQGGGVHPMFREFRSKEERERARDPRLQCDSLDGLCVERALREVPAKNSAALRWAYVHKGSPKKAAQSLGVSFDGLAELIMDGRDMLKNILARKNKSS